MDNTIDIRGLDLAVLFGPADSHLKIIEDSFGVKTVIRNDIIKISGDKNKIPFYCGSHSVGIRFILIYIFSEK